MNKIYCPILSIGFEEPKNGERDPRVCMKDCAWYNEVELKCNISVIAEHLESIEVNLDGVADAVVEMYEYEIPHSYPWEEEDEPFGDDEEGEHSCCRTCKKA